MSYQRFRVLAINFLLGLINFIALMFWTNVMFCKWPNSSDPFGLYVREHVNINLTLRSQMQALACSVSVSCRSMWERTHLPSHWLYKMFLSCVSLMLGRTDMVRVICLLPYLSVFPKTKLVNCMGI